jgi:hypothetical protein
MSSAKLAVAAGLAALSLSACGSAAKPVAGTPQAAVTTRKGLDDPRTKHLKCIRQDHLAVVRVGTAGLQVGALPSGPSITFEPTPGAAQELQIDGQVENAEAIGSALLYPHQASDAVLAKVEDCLALGVTG